MEIMNFYREIPFQPDFCKNIGAFSLRFLQKLIILFTRGLDSRNIQHDGNVIRA